MIELKKLNPNLHATKKYLRWLKESDVKRFTDIKYQKFSIKKIKLGLIINHSLINFIQCIFTLSHFIA